MLEKKRKKFRSVFSEITSFVFRTIVAIVTPFVGNPVSYYKTTLKGTVRVISSNPPCRDDRERFTTVP